LSFLIFEKNYEQSSDDITTCDSLVYSYISALAFWIIASNYLCTNALSGSCTLLGVFERISERNVKGLTTKFCHGDCEKKVKGEAK